MDVVYDPREVGEIFYRDARDSLPLFSAYRSPARKAFRAWPEVLRTPRSARCAIFCLAASTGRSDGDEPPSHSDRSPEPCPGPPRADARDHRPSRRTRSITDSPPVPACISCSRVRCHTRPGRRAESRARTGSDIPFPLRSERSSRFCVPSRSGPAWRPFESDPSRNDLRLEPATCIERFSDRRPGSRHPRSPGWSSRFQLDLRIAHVPASLSPRASPSRVRLPIGSTITSLSAHRQGPLL